MIDKSKEKIGLMFDEIAPAYDKLNHLFTANRDQRWRKEIVLYVKSKGLEADYILDLASGTGDLTKELINLNPDIIIAADISEKMLEVQRNKINYPGLSLVCADAENLPFDDNYFDIITIGFGIRNFENLGKSLSEIKRVLKPEGLLVILEIFKSSGIVSKVFNIYFGKIMPYLGNKISHSKAYTYLFRSVDTFFTIKEFLEFCRKKGFNVDHYKNNFFKVVNTVYLKKNYFNRINYSIQK